MSLRAIGIRQTQQHPSCLCIIANCCLCKRSSRQTTLVCVNASRRNERLPLLLHIAAEITDTYSPSLYISLLLAQIDNINQSFLYALWLCSSYEQQNHTPERASRPLYRQLTQPTQLIVGIVGSQPTIS
jgi:hypothetical protein